MIKICSRCKVGKSVEEFYKSKDGKDGLKSSCKQCYDIHTINYRRKNPERVKEQKRKYRQNNLEKTKQALKKYYQNNLERFKNNKLINSYGITLEHYNNILYEQDGKCAICKKEEYTADPRTQKPKKLSVDHCHTTNKVRGLLCSNCNLSLGKFNDDINILFSAIKYLQKYRDK